MLVEHALTLHPLGDHLLDRVLVRAEAQRPARQVQLLPCVVGGLEQARHLGRLELGDPGRLCLELQDVRLNAIGAGVAVSIPPRRVLDPRYRSTASSSLAVSGDPSAAPTHALMSSSLGSCLRVSIFDTFDCCQPSISQPAARRGARGPPARRDPASPAPAARQDQGTAAPAPTATSAREPRGNSLSSPSADAQVKRQA